MFGSSTSTFNTGPDQDNTEGDTDGLFAYLEGDCEDDESQFACEAERVNIYKDTTNIPCRVQLTFRFAYL